MSRRTVRGQYGAGAIGGDLVPGYREEPRVDPNSTVESYLFSTCTDLGAKGYDTTYGRGLVNASAAVAKTGK